MPYGIDMLAGCAAVPLVVFDCETTGLRATEDAIVECAVARFEGGELVASWSSLINPGRPIPEAASAVHGITDAMVASAPTMAEVAAKLIELAALGWPCAYNAPFDRAFLHAAISGSDCALFDPACEWVDPLVIVRDVDRFERGAGRHKLTAACARHGVDLGAEAHRASADAIAAGRLFYRLAPRFELLSLEALLRRTVTRRAAQDQDFAAWQARQAGRGAKP